MKKQKKKRIDSDGDTCSDSDAYSDDDLSQSEDDEPDTPKKKIITSTNNDSKENTDKWIVQNLQKRLDEDKQDEKIDLDTETFLDWIGAKIIPVKEYELPVRNIRHSFEKVCCLTGKRLDENTGLLIKRHHITDRISCSPDLMVSKEFDEVRCPVCCKRLSGCDFMAITEEKKPVDKKEPVFAEPIYDINNHEVVGIDESEYKHDDDDHLKKMSDCDFNTVSYQIDSPYVQEPLGNRTIEVRTQEEFNQIVEQRYPFLNKINMENVCLAGGFCRSILLKQRLKDFDFFIYGDDIEHEKVFKRLLGEIMGEIKKCHPNMKFLVMYKHLFNVFEVVCISDPKDFFKDDYKLDNFKQYDFRGLKRFDKFTVIDAETGKIFRKNRSKYVQVKDDPQAQNDLNLENIDFSNYFEDGDVRGIHMKYRLQFILTRNKSMGDIFENFDMYPCRVAYDGKTTWFTDKSEKAYKYMINIVNENNYSTLLDHRLSKYFTYGFSIVMPELDMNKVHGGNLLHFGGNKFKVAQVDGKNIIVEHNSHIADHLASLQELEKKSLEKDGKALYKSSLFCSLVSLCRYVKINDVSYMICSDVVEIPDDGNMKFRESEETITFIDKIDSRINGKDLYGNMRAGPTDQKDGNDTDHSD